MPNTLKVSLDKSTTPWSLDVDEKDHANHVSQAPDRQTITWRLNGDAASGSFNGQSNSQPGFSWVGQEPAAGIFGDPGPGPNSNELTMSDLNNGPGTTGDWVYQLSATIGGVVYQSNARSLTSTNTNPTIKNT